MINSCRDYFIGYVNKSRTIYSDSDRWFTDWKASYILVVYSSVIFHFIFPQVRSGIIIIYILV